MNADPKFKIHFELKPHFMRVKIRKNLNNEKNYFFSHNYHLKFEWPFTGLKNNVKKLVTKISQYKKNLEIKKYFEESRDKITSNKKIS